MRFDRFELRVNRQPDIRRNDGYLPVEFRINGTPFIDLVREIELPFANEEYDARIASGEVAEDLGLRGFLAGNYLYPNSKFFRHTRNFLGEPYRHGFITDPGDPRNQKSLLLGCTCGITDCWFLLASISVTTDTVRWADFCQFHRDWSYPLGPFVFDRIQYEAQLDPERWSLSE
jgi:hypothetical protein